MTSKWPEKESDLYNTDKKWGSKVIRTTRYCRSKHDWGTWHVLREATDEEEGIETRTCNNDSRHTQQRSIPVLGHVHELTKVDAVEPTCTENGNIEYWICEGCGRYFTDDEWVSEVNEEDVFIEALGHDYIGPQVTQKAACTAKGIRTYACVKCNETKTETIAALGHKWKHYKKAAGLLKNGTEYDYCTTCKTKKNVKTLKGYATYYVKSFKVAKAKKAFTAKWVKQSASKQKKFNGYQLRYSLKSNMKGAKYATAKKSSTSKKISKLKAKKTYYVQVRTYTKKSGTTFYSKWSSKKKVKTKKHNQVTTF